MAAKSFTSMNGCWDGGGQFICVFPSWFGVEQILDEHTADDDSVEENY